MLLVHGFPEYWGSWRHQMEALAGAGYRAVAMDLRGFGESDRPTDVAAYALPNSLRDVDAVLDSLGGRAALVSHDWGGAVGWVYTAFNAHRVERLCAMNAPHPNAFRGMSHYLPQLQASWYMFFFQFEGIAEEALSRNGNELLTQWFFGTASVPLPDEDLTRYVELFSRPGALTAALNWYRANVPPAALVAADGIELPTITRPTMLLWGLDDAYLTFEIGRRAGDYVDAPFALHALPDTGHWIQQERPDEVNRLLVDFLASDFG